MVFTVVFTFFVCDCVDFALGWCLVLVCVANTVTFELLLLMAVYAWLLA